MPKVKICEYSNYEGRSQELGPGRYSGDALAIPDNAVSSVTVPAGWKVTLWSDSTFVGASRVLTANSPTLSGFDDTLSALTVTAPRDEAIEESTGSLGFLATAGSPTWVSIGALDIDFSSASRGFTFEAWVWFDSTGWFARIFDFHKAGANGVDNILLTRDGSSADLRLEVRKAGALYAIYARGVIENGQWLHIATTIDPAGYGRIFCNGTQVAAGQLVVPTTVTRDSAWLGRSAWTQDAYFAGQMAEVRLWSVVRSDVEIRRAMSSRLTGAEAGLLRYYRMDEKSNSGGTLRDLAGRSNGLVVGSALYALSGPKLAAAPDAAGGLWFDGVSDYVTLPPVDADFSTGFTIEAWVNFADSGSYARVLELCRAWGVDSIIVAREGTTANLGLWISRAGVTGTIIATGVIQNGVWLHVAATLYNVAGGTGTAALYIDGQLRASGSIVAPLPGPRATAFLGKSSAAWDALFKGRMSEVRMWSRARTQEEIQAARYQRLDPKEPGLVAYYPLDERDSTLAHDVSPSGLDGRLQAGIGWGQALPADYVPRLPPATALVFNGTDTYLQLPTVNADFSAGLTLEAWVYFDSVANWARIFELASGPLADNIVLARYGTSSDIAFVSCLGDAYAAVYAPGVIATGRWMHVAATLGPAEADGRALGTIFINGTARATGRVYPGKHLSRARSCAGKSTYADPLFKGRMAELRIWTRPRTQDEIRATMSQPLLGSEAGLHLYYPLSETSGSVANAQILPGPSGTPPWPLASTMVFNGSDTFLQLPSPTAEVPQPALTADFTQGFTIEAWVYYDEATSWARIVELGNGRSSDNIVLFRNNTSNQLVLCVFRGSAAEQIVGDNALAPRGWLHVAATLGPPGADGKGTVTLYQNGVALASGRMWLPLNVARSQCYIGKSTWAGDTLFKGRMAELRIWTCARSQAEIASTMNRPLLGSEPGLCVYRSLSTRQTATIQGTVRRQLPDLPMPTAGVLALDGVDDAVKLPTLDVDLSRGFSLEFWLYLEDLAGSPTCLVELGPTSGVGRVTIRHEGPSGTLRFTVWNSALTGMAVVAPGVLVAGQWLHIAVAQDAGTASSAPVSIYVNGERRATGPTWCPPYVQRDSSWIGQSSYGTGGRLRGRVADLRIYALARSQAEIQSGMKTPCAENELGLAYHFPLDDAGAAVARDQARQSGTLVGPVDWAALPHKNYLEFDGTNTCVTITSLPSGLLHPTLYGAVTVEAWVLFTSRTWSTAIIDLGAGMGLDNLFLATETTTTNLRLYTFNGSTMGFIEAVGVIKDGVWMHVAATLESPSGDGRSAATLYINGEAKARGQTPGLRSVDRPKSYLGSSSWWPSYYNRLRGRLSDVRIWSRCRTQAEIRATMGRPLQGEQPGIYRYYPLTETGNQIKECVSGGLDTVSGRPAYATMLPTPDGRGLRFAGNNGVAELPGQGALLAAGLTLELWLCPGGAARGNEVYVAFGGGTRGTSVQLWRNHAADRFILSVGSGARLPSFRFAVARTAEAWVHLAATVDASQQVVIYTNGVRAFAGSLNTLDECSILPEARSRLGMGLDSNFPFEGRMTEVRLWNRVRSASEIAAAYGSRASGSEPGLCRYYPLNDLWGLRVRDGGSHTAATLQGDPQRFRRRLPGAALPPSGARGLEFNGTSTYVALPMIRADFSAGFTFEAWVYFDGVQSGASLIELGRGELADNIILGRRDGTTQLALTVVRGGAAQTSVSLPGTIVDRTWMHVAATVDDAFCTFYVNGTLRARWPRGEWVADLTPAAGVGRGKSYLGKSNREVPLFKGRMADVRLWRRARSAEEIAGDVMGSLALDDPALVANYRLDEGGGLRVGDAASARLDAEVRGMKALWRAPSPHFLPDPNQAGCLDFNGRTDWVELPVLTPSFGEGFTIEAWVNFADNGAYARIVEVSNGWNVDSLIVHRDNATNNLGLTTKGPAGSGFLAAPGVITNGTWMHVAVTFGNIVYGGGLIPTPWTGTATIYINGQVVSSGSVAAPSKGNHATCYLGKSTASWDPLFKGRMAEVRLWTVCRSADEIRRDRSRRLLGSENGLIAYYRLNETDGERVGDASRYGRHAWLRGAGDWSQAAPLPGISKDGDPGVLRMVGQLWVTLPAIVPPATQTVPVGWCLEAWVVCNDVSRSGHFIALSNGGTDALYLGHNGTSLVFGVQVGGGATQVVTVPGVFSNGPWVHIAASIDENGQLWLCKNGEVLPGDKSSVTPPSFGARSQAELGRSAAGTLFMGYLSEVRIWTTPRPPRQVSETRLQRLGGTIPGLYACYPLLATRGLAAIDAGALRRDGVVYGSSAPIWDGNPPYSHTLPAAAAARTPAALSLDGASTYARLPAISADLSSGFTIEVTLRADGQKPVGTILDLGNGAAGDNLQVIARDDGRLALRIYVGATTFTEVVTRDPWLLQDTWQSFAFAVDGGRVVRFQDATVPVTIDGTAGSLLPIGRMPAAGVTRALGYLGRGSAATGRLFKGYLRDVRLWSRARSDSEISAARSLKLSGLEPGLIALYPLDDVGGRLARSATPGLGAARLFGDALWGVPTAAAPAASASAPVPARSVPKTTIDPSTVLPILGSDASVSGVQTTWEAGITTDDTAVSTALTAYAGSGLQFSLLGVSSTFRFTGAVTVKPLSQVISLTCTPSLQIGSSSTYQFPATTLAMRRGSSPPVYTLCLQPGSQLNVTSLVASAVQDPLLKATYSTVLVPFLDLLAGCVLLVASDDGSDDTYGSYVKGINLFVTRKLSELPVLSLLHGALPALGLDTRSAILSIGLRSTAGYRVSAGALLNIKILNTGPVSLEFNELGIELSSAQTATSIGVVHRFTLTLLGEVLVFRGGVSVEQTGGASAVTVWGALDPDQARGTTWKDPWGLRGIEIGGFGVQVRGGTAIGIGCRGEIHIGGGLLGGSVGLNIDTANPILFIDSPEGLDLPRLVAAFLGGLPAAAQSAISALNTALAIRLKDLKLYFAPNGGEIAGQTFERGISLGASLDLLGYRANLFGRLDASSGAVLRGQADRIKIDVAGVTLLQFSDVSGNNGPNVDFSLTTSRQGVFYSGQLRLLGGVYQGYEELSVGSDGISFRGGSPLGALAVTLNWQTGLFALTMAPRFVYSFEALGIPVNIDIGGEVAQRVDKAGFQQSLKFWFSVCGTGFSVGPVSWSVPLIDISAIGEVFEAFFGDLVKRFFTDTIAGGLKQAYEWVRDNLTDLAEEAVEIFKAAGVAVADIAKNVYATFDASAREVISFVGGTINQAADLLRNSLNLAVSEAAQVLGAAYGVGETAVRAALGAAGYVADEINSIAGQVWEGINQVVGYLDPTSW